MMRPTSSPSSVVSVARLPGTLGLRLAAVVGGEPVWFESDSELQLPVEAVVSAFLLPTAQRGATLSLSDAMSARFHGNMPYVLALAKEWWGWSAEIPHAPSAQTLSDNGSSAVRYRASALMFSGGVDSFFSLLRGPIAPDVLVLAEGFDTPLQSHREREASLNVVKAVAAERGISSMRVATNLREHSHFASCNWELSHGGALAAIGHVIGNQASHILISSSTNYANATKPWGSHFRLDELWSSDHVTMLNVCSTHRRGEKLLAIAHEPLVQQHLRVCWENLTDGLNCGICEKCIRTQLLLLERGYLGQFKTFSQTLTALADAVNRLTFVGNRATLNGSYSRLDLTCFPTPLADAVRGLRNRSVAEHAKRQRKASAWYKALHHAKQRLFPGGF